MGDDPYTKIKPKKRPGKEFYLNASKQYVYVPREKLEFTDGKALVYENNKFVFKLGYLPKLVFSIIGVTSMMQANAMLDFTIISHLVVGLTAFVGLGHSLFGARVLNSMYLKEDGKTVEITYKPLPLLKVTKSMDISTFKPKGNPYIMVIWSLNPVPSNLISFVESDINDLLPMYLMKNSFNFFIMRRKPQSVNEEIFANICNGVYISTRVHYTRVALFSERYKEYQ